MSQPGLPRFSPGAFGGRLAVGLIGLGILVIGVGWNGAAGQTSILAQIPYLLSGGMIGLGLVITGAALLVVQGAREDRARLEAKLDALADVVIETSGTSRQKSPSDLSGLVVAGTASYHVPGCRLVDGREETGYLTPAEARARDLKPCRVCSPESAALA